MIQRIQTVFLALCSFSFFGLFGLPLASSTNVASPIFEDQLYTILDHPALLSIAIISGALALVTIFLFKKRKLQLTLTKILIILCVILPVLAYLLILQNAVNLESLEISEGWGIALPIFSLIMAILANRYILKDQKLVKSMDRLR